MAISLSGRYSVNDSELQAKIRAYAAFTGRTTKDVTRKVMKAMLRYALQLTPPGSNKNSSPRAAKAAGEAAISRDLNLMGFVPVAIKGYRRITQVYGHPLKKPIRVPTKLNPRFANPDAIHRARLLSKHGGRVTRGGSQAYYVDRTLFRSMFVRLKGEVGRLASGFTKAARALGVPVPEFIARHGGSRGTELLVSETPTSYALTVVNHFPAGAEKEAEAFEQRLAYLKQIQVRSLTAELDALLKKGWHR